VAAAAFAVSVHRPVNKPTNAVRACATEAGSATQNGVISEDFSNTAGVCETDEDFWCEMTGQFPATPVPSKSCAADPSGPQRISLLPIFCRVIRAALYFEYSWNEFMRSWGRHIVRIRADDSWVFLSAWQQVA
jgi:hypothetical protein